MRVCPFDRQTDGMSSVWKIICYILLLVCIVASLFFPRFCTREVPYLVKTEVYLNVRDLLRTYIDKYPLQQNEPGCSLRMFYEHKFSDNTVYKHKS